MTPEERSATLRRQADEVLEGIHLREHCAAIGSLIPTGSYFLDLMMYPDIDLYLPPTTADNLLMLGSKLARYDCVKKLNFEKGGPGDLKEGLYIKPVVQWGNWERQWKIDIWSLPTLVVEKKQAQLMDLKRRMTAEQRHRILDTKQRLLTPAGRTPMFSGIYIYKAIIDHDLRELAQIVQFLRDNGIEVQLPNQVPEDTARKLADPQH